MPYRRALCQLSVSALQNRKASAKYFRRNVLNWIELIQTALWPTQRSIILAALTGAVFEGLFADFMSTGDLRRTTLAIDQFIEIAAKHTRATGRSAS